MSETVKLIIEIPTDLYKHVQGVKAWFLEDSAFLTTIKNGIPLDSNSEKAEVQAYFAGQTYGWEQGRKALIDDVKAEINEERVFARDDFRQYKVDILGVDPETVDDEYPNDEFHKGMERAVDIINKHISGEGASE